LGTEQSLISETQLWKHGGILFSRLWIRRGEWFQAVYSNYCWRLVEIFFSTPHQPGERQNITSTRYPAASHCTMKWLILEIGHWKSLFCVKETSEHGGEAPIANNRKVFESLDSKIRKVFPKKKVVYVRNYGGGVIYQRKCLQYWYKLEVKSIAKRKLLEMESGDRLRLAKYNQKTVAELTNAGKWCG